MVEDKHVIHILQYFCATPYPRIIKSLENAFYGSLFKHPTKRSYGTQSSQIATFVDAKVVGEVLTHHGDSKMCDLVIGTLGLEEVVERPASDEVVVNPS